MSITTTYNTEVNQTAGPATSNAPTPTQFTFQENAPNDYWIVNHNLNAYPVPVVIDSNGNVVDGDIRYKDANTLFLVFTNPFSGTAYLTI